MKWILLLFLCQTISGQTLVRSGVIKVARFAQPSSGGGGGNTFALVDHNVAGVNSVNDNHTTVNTTGAKLLVISISIGNVSGGNTGPVCNSGTDTPHLAVVAGSPGGLGTNEIWYVINPTQTTGYDVFTIRNYQTVCLESFSYTGTTPTFDIAASGSGSSAFTTLQPGTLTPTGTELMVTAIGGWGTTTPQTASINSSFSITDQLLETSTGAFGAMAWKNSSSAENPTWTSSATTAGGVNMVMFK